MVATSSESAGYVRIVHGANDGSFNVARFSIADVRESLIDAFNIPADAIAFVNGGVVCSAYKLQTDDCLEFVSPSGVKGALEPEELARIDRMEQSLAKIESWLSVIAKQRVIKDWYNTKDVAELLGKKEYTVREWCRLKRVHAQKVAGGRGNEGEWRIRHDELMRIQNEGLLPMPTRY